MREQRQAFLVWVRCEEEHFEVFVEKALKVDHH